MAYTVSLFMLGQKDIYDLLFFQYFTVLYKINP